jgi:hypothetical protein
MHPMSSRLILELFSSWQLIIVCTGIMFLLPLIFYLASRRPARLVRLPRPALKKPARARPTPKAQTREENPEGDEVEFKDLK